MAALATLMSHKPWFVAVVALLVSGTGAGCSAETSDAGDAEDAVEDGALGTSEDAIGSSFICERRTYGRLDATPGRLGQLVAVRVGRPGNFDRFVMEFKRGTQVPRFTITKEADGTFAQNEGPPLRLGGSAGLYVNTYVASGWDFEKGVPTYTGPKRIGSASTRLITEAGQVEDFEGTLGWGMGLRAPVCFRVTKLSDPPRLVVDVQRKPS